MQKEAGGYFRPIYTSSPTFTIIQLALPTFSSQLVIHHMITFAANIKGVILLQL